MILVAKISSSDLAVNLTPDIGASQDALESLRLIIETTTEVNNVLTNSLDEFLKGIIKND